MAQITFDSLECYELLRSTGVDDRQAKAQAEILRNFEQAIDEKYRSTIATKADLKETELKLQKEMEQVRLTLQKEIEQAKYSMLKWQIGIGAILVGIMGRGFGWLRF